MSRQQKRKILRDLQDNNVERILVTHIAFAGLTYDQKEILLKSPPDLTTLEILLQLENDGVPKKEKTKKTVLDGKDKTTKKEERK